MSEVSARYIKIPVGGFNPPKTDPAGNGHITLASAIKQTQVEKLKSDPKQIQGDVFIKAGNNLA